MKHLKSYFQLYESNDNDYIGMILSNLSDTAPKLLSNYFDDKVLLYDLNITSGKWDDDELLATVGRLEDEGWSLLNISGVGYNSIFGFSSDPGVYCSLIKTDYLKSLKSKGVTLWEDLDWGDWHLNKSTSSKCLQAKIVTPNGNILSIIDGMNDTGPSFANGYIDWIEVLDSDSNDYGKDVFNFSDRDGGFNAKMPWHRFDNKIEAEIKLLELQID